MLELHSFRFMLLRCTEASSETGARADRICDAIEQTLYDRHVQLVLRQHNEDATSVAIVCAPASRLDHAVRRLAEKGFDFGPDPSADVILREGHVLKLRFRSNVGLSGENGDVSDVSAAQTFVFNSNIETRLDLSVAVVDRFAQKSVECFRGFAQVFKTSTPAPTPGEAPAADDANTDAVTSQRGESLVAELLIRLPKVFSKL